MHRFSVLHPVEIRIAIILDNYPPIFVQLCAMVSLRETLSRFVDLMDRVVPLDGPPAS